MFSGVQLWLTILKKLLKTCEKGGEEKGHWNDVKEYITLQNLNDICLKEIVPWKKNKQTNKNIYKMMMLKVESSGSYKTVG